MSLIARLRRRGNLSTTTLQRSDVVTIALTYFTLGASVSAIHIDDGSAPLVVIGAAMVVYSATATLAFAAVTASGGSFVAAVGSGWLVSTRFGAMAAAVAPLLPSKLLRRIGFAHLALDPNVAVALAQTNAAAARRAYAVMALWVALAWWAGSAAGVVLGGWLGDPEALGIDALLPALLVALIWPQFKTTKHRWIGLGAALIAVGLLPVLPGGVPVLLAGATALWALTRPPAEAQHSPPAEAPHSPPAEEDGPPC